MPYGILENDPEAASFFFPTDIPTPTEAEIKAADAWATGLTVLGLLADGSAIDLKDAIQVMASQSNQSVQDIQSSTASTLRELLSEI
jgi:hypothetical protein